jgi:hypothetical protein
VLKNWMILPVSWVDVVLRSAGVLVGGGVGLFDVEPVCPDADTSSSMTVTAVVKIIVLILLLSIRLPQAWQANA